MEHKYLQGPNMEDLVFTEEDERQTILRGTLNHGHKFFLNI